MLDVITDNLDVWTTAQKQKKVVGRGRAKKEEGYGVKKLRELILELAVRGKLVPQDASDEPASALLEKIAEEKQRLIKEGKIKKQKALPGLGGLEKLFKKPCGWEWTYLGDIAQIVRGITFPANEKSKTPEDGRFACLRTTNVQDSIEWEDMLFIREKFIKRQDQIIQESDIVMSMANSRELVGKVALVKHQPHTNTTFGGFLGVIRPSEVLPQFLMTLLRVPTNRNILIGSASQTTNIANISLAKLNPLLLAIPPLSEQHRIVAKVDELMTLCDQLEQEHADHQATHQTLVKILLNGLVESAKSQATSEVNNQQSTTDYFNQLIAQHFDTLFTTEQSIDQLKQTILQLAVMGKLVPQDPNDEPASVLLEKIAQEKTKLIEEGKIKKQKALPEVREDEKQYKLATGWSWARMTDICTLITDGTHQTPTYTDNGRIFISAQNIKPLKFMPEKHRWVSEEDYQIYVKNRKPEYGDILLTRVGAGIGEAAVINVELDFAIYVSVGLLKPSKGNIFHDYLVCWLNSPLGRNYSERNTLGKGVSQGNLNLSLIRKFVVSIPPIKEQHRIVSKVSQLLTLCDSLKANQNQAQITQTQLADAIVKQTVN